jgi:hypothetical protein
VLRCGRASVGAVASSELYDEACPMKSVNSAVMPLSACSDSSLLAELVSRDARGDASGQVCGILVAGVRLGWRPCWLLGTSTW